MFRVLVKVTITQKPAGDFPDRNKKLLFDFVNSYDSSDSWDTPTNKAKVTLPKNIYIRNGEGGLVALGAPNVSIGGFDPASTPLFLRGDGITIQAGYKYISQAKDEITAPLDKLGNLATIFTGYITEVGTKQPIELNCEDNMYLLKQIIVPNRQYLATDTLESIFTDLLKGTPFTVNDLAKTSVGPLRTENETVAELLSRIRKDYHFESYFRGNELRIGSVVYVEQDAIDDGKKVFKFQQDIISDDLSFQRKDDINLSAVAYSINKIELGGLTKKGKKRTTSERLEVLVSSRNGTFVRTQKPPGQTADFAPNMAGERRTLYFWNVTDIQKLGDLAEQELTKFYYTGLRGKFTTFGIPLVRQGDNVDIIDPVLPDKNGRYKVKEVHYTGGVSGIRQEISLDYLINRLDNQGNVILLQ